MTLFCVGLSASVVQGLNFPVIQLPFGETFNADVNAMYNWTYYFAYTLPTRHQPFPNSPYAVESGLDLTFSLQYEITSCFPSDLTLSGSHFHIVSDCNTTVREVGIGYDSCGTEFFNNVDSNVLRLPSNFAEYYADVYDIVNPPNTVITTLVFTPLEVRDPFICNCSTHEIDASIIYVKLILPDGPCQFLFHTSITKMYCQNGGTFIPTTDLCQCVPGYTGNDCSVIDTSLVIPTTEIIESATSSVFSINFPSGPFGANILVNSTSNNSTNSHYCSQMPILFYRYCVLSTPITCPYQYYSTINRTQLNNWRTPFEFQYTDSIVTVNNMTVDPLTGSLITLPVSPGFVPVSYKCPSCPAVLDSTVLSISWRVFILNDSPDSCLVTVTPTAVPDCTIATLKCTVGTSICQSATLSTSSLNYYALHAVTYLKALPSNYPLTSSTPDGLLYSSNCTCFGSYEGYDCSVDASNIVEVINGDTQTRTTTKGSRARFFSVVSSTNKNVKITLTIVQPLPDIDFQIAIRATLGTEPPDLQPRFDNWPYDVATMYLLGETPLEEALFPDFTVYSRDIINLAPANRTTTLTISLEGTSSSATGDFRVSGNQKFYVDVYVIQPYPLFPSATYADPIVTMSITIDDVYSYIVGLCGLSGIAAMVVFTGLYLCYLRYKQGSFKAAMREAVVKHDDFGRKQISHKQSSHTGNYLSPNQTLRIMVKEGGSKPGSKNASRATSRDNSRRNSRVDIQPQKSVPNPVTSDPPECVKPSSRNPNHKSNTIVPTSEPLLLNGAKSNSDSCVTSAPSAAIGEGSMTLVSHVERASEVDEPVATGGDEGVESRRTRLERRKAERAARKAAREERRKKREHEAEKEAIAIKDDRRENCKVVFTVILVVLGVIAAIIFETAQIFFNISFLSGGIPGLDSSTLRQKMSDAFGSIGLSPVADFFGYLFSLFDYIQIFSQIGLSWNCGGSISMAAPVVLFIGGLFLVLILQKDLLLKIVITVNKSKTGTSVGMQRLKYAYAALISVIALFMLQIAVLTLTNVVTQTWSITRSCSTFDASLVKVGRIVCIIFIVLLFYIALLAFAGIRDLSFYDLTWGWIRGIKCLIILTFGVWTTETMIRFDILNRAKKFRNHDDDNQQLNVMRLMGHSRSLLWLIFPYGVILTKGCETVNNPVIFIFLTGKRGWNIEKQLNLRIPFQRRVVICGVLILSNLYFIRFMF